MQRLSWREHRSGIKFRLTTLLSSPSVARLSVLADSSVGDQHMPLSDGARKLLKHFQDKHLQPMKYEYVQVMRDLFGDAESCERAQAELAELARVDLLESGMPRLSHKSWQVTVAAPTHAGSRYLEDNPIE